jgi:hypothetical protein
MLRDARGCDASGMASSLSIRAIARPRFSGKGLCFRTSLRADLTEARTIDEACERRDPAPLPAPPRKKSFH